MFLAGKEFELVESQGEPHLLRVKEDSLVLTDFWEARGDIKALLEQYLALRVHFTALGSWYGIGDNQQGPREIQNNVLGATYWHRILTFHTFYWPISMKIMGAVLLRFYQTTLLKGFKMSAVGHSVSNINKMLSVLVRASTLKDPLADAFDSALQSEPDLMRVDWSRNPNTLLIFGQSGCGASRSVSAFDSRKSVQTFDKRILGISSLHPLLHQATLAFSSSTPQTKVVPGPRPRDAVAIAARPFSSGGFFCVVRRSTTAPKFHSARLLTSTKTRLPSASRHQIQLTFPKVNAPCQHLPALHRFQVASRLFLAP